MIELDDPKQERDKIPYAADPIAEKANELEKINAEFNKAKVLNLNQKFEITVHNIPHTCRHLYKIKLSDTVKKLKKKIAKKGFKIPFENQKLWKINQENSEGD